MKAVKTVLARIWWLGRGTATVMGLAMLLALTVGLASAALAAVPGDPFKLGRINAIDRVTQLVGTTNDAMLRIENDGKGENATALELHEDPKKPPMRINSFAKVEKLNADLLDGRESNQFVTITDKASDSDRLDGKDSEEFFSGKVYYRSASDLGVGDGTSNVVVVSCDEGDVALGGGGGDFDLFNHDDYVLESGPGVIDDGRNWVVRVQDSGAASRHIVSTRCADFPPLRP